MKIKAESAAEEGSKNNEAEPNGICLFSYLADESCHIKVQKSEKYNKKEEEVWNRYENIVLSLLDVTKIS